MYEWPFELWSTFLTAIAKWTTEIAAGIVIAVLLFASRKGWKFARALVDYHYRIGRALGAVKRIGAGSQLREGPGLWLTKPITVSQSDDYETRLKASKVLVVANAKGGVGKTTIAANIGARLAEILPKPVLMIDLDFQGTLSSMAIADSNQWVPPHGKDSGANRLISGDLRPSDIAATGLHAAGAPNLKIIPAFYDLAQAENRVMIEWLLGDRRYDVRFRLADLLHDPLVRSTFSVIIIDSPPRLTTGAIQALAAATHLLIPTVLDDPSAEAVVSFVRQIETFKNECICEYIEYLGVVGSIGLTTQNTKGPQKRLSDRLNAPVNAGGAGNATQLLPEKLFLPRSAHFSHAVGEGGIAYIMMGNSEGERKIKDRIRALADYVKEAMKL